MPVRGATVRGWWLLIALVAGLSGLVEAQGRGAQAPPATPRAAAPIDLTGYWVAIISEDWRWRMVTPSRGDIASIPVNPAAQTIAEAWDPAKDEAAGEQCKAYGAPGLMRGPTRLHITWLDDTTLKVESDYGIQTRLLHFRTPAPAQGAKTWQGVSTAQWVMAAGGRGRGPTRSGSMKSVTTQLSQGYLRTTACHTCETSSQYGTSTRGNGIGTGWRPRGRPVYLHCRYDQIHFKGTRGSKWEPTPATHCFSRSRSR